MKIESNLDGVISVFQKYPELSCVKYQATENLIKMEFALNGDLGSKKEMYFTNKVMKSLKLYYKILNIEPPHIELRFSCNCGISLLRFTRDLTTFKENELELFIILLRLEFMAILVRDDSDILARYSVSNNRENSLIQVFKQESQPYESIFVYRDEGRVFVFNK